MSKRILSVAFKAYHQHHGMLLPPSLEELIGPDHPVRIVSQVLDKIDIDPLLKKYRGGGAQQLSSVHAVKSIGVCLHQ
jgi:transposase